MQWRWAVAAYHHLDNARPRDTHMADPGGDSLLSHLATRPIASLWIRLARPTRQLARLSWSTSWS